MNTLVVATVVCVWCIYEHKKNLKCFIHNDKCLLKVNLKNEY